MLVNKFTVIVSCISVLGIVVTLDVPQLGVIVLHPYLLS